MIAGFLAAHAARMRRREIDRLREVKIEAFDISLSAEFSIHSVAVRSP